MKLTNIDYATTSFGWELLRLGETAVTQAEVEKTPAYKAACDRTELLPIIYPAAKMSFPC
jgi:hypothetical protein